MATSRQMLQAALETLSADFISRAELLRRRHGVQHVRKLRRTTRFLRFILDTWSTQVDAPEARLLADQLVPLGKRLAHARDAATVERVARLLTKETAHGKKRKLQKTGSDLTQILKGRRQALAWPVLDEVDKLLRSGITADLHAMVAPPISAEDSPRTTDPASEYLDREVHRMLSEVLQFQHSLSEPADVEGRHTMRKLARAPLVLISYAPPELQSSLDTLGHAIRLLRRLLGEVHDVEDAQSFLPAFCQAEADQLGETRTARFITYTESTLATWHDEYLGALVTAEPETVAVCRHWVDAHSF